MQFGPVHAERGAYVAAYAASNAQQKQGTAPWAVPTVPTRVGSVIEASNQPFVTISKTQVEQEYVWELSNYQAVAKGDYIDSNGRKTETPGTVAGDDDVRSAGVQAPYDGKYAAKNIDFTFNAVNIDNNASLNETIYLLRNLSGDRTNSTSDTTTLATFLDTFDTSTSQAFHPGEMIATIGKATYSVSVREAPKLGSDGTLSAQGADIPIIGATDIVGALVQCATNNEQDSNFKANGVIPASSGSGSGN